MEPQKSVSLIISKADPTCHSAQVQQKSERMTNMTSFENFLLLQNIFSAKIKEVNDRSLVQRQC